ncbi:MAG: hypothetical protein AABX02_01290, partial [archaeon]
MRTLIACIILFLFAGCVDYQLSGNEKLACANFTNVNVTGIPVCEKSTSCQEKFAQEVGNSSFEWLPIGNEWEKTKNQTISTWISLNETQTKLKQVNGYCKSGNVLLIWSAGIDSAGAIQNGLKSAEQANVNTLDALTQSMKTAQKWELFRVKDTDAFHAYAELLEIVQGISENDQKNETASIFSQNQEYFEGLSSHITHNQTNGMSVDWKSAFDVYKTGIKYGGDQAKTILLFSPVWQGLISSFSSQKKAVESLSVLQYINAPQMVEKIAQTVRPQNGFVGNTLRALKKMEGGMQKLEKEESENHQHIHEELEKTGQLMTAAEIQHQEWEKWETTILAWANATGVSIPAATNSIQQWKNQLKGYEEEWNTLNEGKEKGSVSVGMKIESQRGILKGL